MPEVFLLPLGADTGGVNIGIVNAFRHEPGWTVRTMIGGQNYIDYPPDLPWDKQSMIQHWRQADVLHLSHDYYRLRRIERHRLPRKPSVMHYHGTGFREDAARHIREQRAHGGIGICSSLDLWLLAPDSLTWVPNPLQNRPCEPRRATERPGMVKVAHAPTSRKIKGTEAFLRAVRRLQAEGVDLELDLIEGVPWTECLRRKADADIYYDQVQLGYGNNAIEAWGMGIPVIAGAADATKAEMERRFGGLPFYEATETTIYAALKALAASADLRAEYADRGLAHVQRWHDQRYVVSVLKEIYLRAMGQRS